MAEEFKPDLVECAHIWAADQAAMRLGLPFVSAARNSDQIGFERDTRMRAFTRRSAAASLAIFTSSCRIQEKVLDLYPVVPEKVHLLPNGYNQRVFYPQTVSRSALFAKYGLVDNGLPILTYAGHLSTIKGTDVLLAANDILQERCPINLIICGAGNIENIPAPEGGLRNVFHLGHQPPEKLAQWHNIAVANTMPSRSEGFGISALEATACGTPVIATPTGVLDDLASVVIPFDDPAALAAAVEMIIDLPENEYRARRLEAARRAGQFTWPSIISRRLHYYRKALGEIAA